MSAPDTPAAAEAAEFLYKHGELTYGAAWNAIGKLTSNGFRIQRLPLFDGDEATKANCHCDRLHPAADLCASGQQVRPATIAHVIAEMMERAGEPRPNGDILADVLCQVLPAALTPAPQPEVAPMDNTALVDVAASLAAAISLLESGGKSAKKAAASDKMFDQMLADYRASLERARTALASREAPQPATPTAQEAVSGLRIHMVSSSFEGQEDMPDEPGVLLVGSVDAVNSAARMLGDEVVLYSHPPQPSEAVAEATKHALDACRIIDAAVLEGHDNTSDLILHLIEAVEPARSALRALKGEEA